MIVYNNPVYNDFVKLVKEFEFLQTGDERLWIKDLDRVFICETPCNQIWVRSGKQLIAVAKPPNKDNVVPLRRYLEAKYRK